MGRAAREAERKVGEYLAEIGRRGGLISRRELTRQQAKEMVAIRETKRAAERKGKPLIARIPLTRQKPKKSAASLPAIRKRSFPTYARRAKRLS